MRGKKAKQIRKLIYGDMAIVPKYFITKKTGGQIFRDDKRRMYQKAKKAYKEGIR